MAAFLKSFAQISTQTPLDEGFFTAPKSCENAYCRAQEADYTKFIPAMAARRMGPILKRAVATTVTALRGAGMENSDAMIFGTGLGCIDNTEKFLTAMIDNGETCLQPTYFINSTHNTIASQVATFLKCHGYNSTYAHLGISFESALMDALMQFETEMISSAVVGGHDEMTPTYFHLFDKVGYWKAPLGECAVSAVLSATPGGIEVKDADLAYSLEREALSDRLRSFLSRNGVSASEIGLVVTGRNGDDRYDPAYDMLLEDVFGNDIAQCWYKHIFGESFTAGAFGFTLGASIMEHEVVPQEYLHGEAAPKSFDNVLIVNSFQSTDWSFILLRK